MRAAHAGWLIALAVLASGCGKDEKPKEAATTATQPATVAEKPPATQPPTANPRPKPSKPARKRPEYKPVGYHKHRARGVIYGDEQIGEDVLTARYDRIIELFGPPAVRKGKCIRYRILGKPKGQSWEFCFKGQTMTAASVEPGYQ